MPTVLTLEAVEESTYVITAAFTDEDGVAVVPNVGLAWTLTDEFGNVINSRSAIVIAPATSVTIVLQGDDLATDDTTTRRILNITGTYDSSLGAGLPLIDEAQFEITDLHPQS